MWGCFGLNSVGNNQHEVAKNIYQWMGRSSDGRISNGKIQIQVHAQTSKPPNFLSVQRCSNLFIHLKLVEFFKVGL
jgi:hypothetical protein